MALVTDLSTTKRGKNDRIEIMKLSRAKRERIGYSLIFIGILLIVSVIVVNAVDLFKSEKAVKTFKETKVVVDYDESDRSKKSEDETAYSTAEDDNKQELAQIIGLLKISKISLEEAVREGSTSSVLSSALGHMEGTALPGEEGNCCIAGHRNYTFGKYFNRLNEMEIGDFIELETYDANYVYEINDIFVVEPTEVSVLDDIEGENLTLITCTPLFIGSHRLIIRAILVNKN